MKNPLLSSSFTTPFGSIPFDKIELAHYEIAFKVAIDIAEQEIQQIITNPAKPSFKNTIYAMETMGVQLDIVSSVFFNLNSAETNDEMQEIAQKISPLLSDFNNNIWLNEQLFNRVKQVYEQEKENLNKVDQKLLSETFKSFVLNGALLNETAKQKIRTINKDLSLKSLQYGENLLSENKKFELLITNEKDLVGLPDYVMKGAAMAAAEANKIGYLFTLDYPSYIPFMNYAENRELRQKMYQAFSSKANKNDACDNKKLIVELVKLKAEKAKILGFKSYADYVLSERMVKSVDQVKIFLNELYTYSLHKAKKELNELEEFAQNLNAQLPLQKWDIAYYSEKLKIAKIAFDETLLKPYFQLEKVIDGVFDLAKQLFGLTFKQTTAIPVYHKEVKTYEIYDDSGKFMALFYGDFFPRKGKRQGAWMTYFKGQHLDNNGVDHRPHVVNVCNFTKPTADTPSLLTFDEVCTLFHEFGHALHLILSEVPYKSLAGTNVLWDFVELPSQLLENWCYEKEALDCFAKHYENGSVIPAEYIDQIKASLQFRSGSASLRQIGLGTLDIAWHDENLPDEIDVNTFEQNVLEEFDLLPKVPDTCMSTQFGHIFQGGYSAGYYSYKWAEVLEADVFDSFKENGIFDHKTAQKLRDTILSKGGSEDPEKLFIDFKGRKASSKPLLKKLALIEE